MIDQQPIKMFKVALIHPNARLPTRATPLSAGMDLYSAIDSIIEPQSVGLVNTGIKISMDKGVYGRIAPRSSLSLRYISIGAGVIDPDYIGEVIVVVFNNHPIDPFEIISGTRIAQLILEKIAYHDIIEVPLDDPVFCGERNVGFGASGK